MVHAAVLRADPLAVISVTVSSANDKALFLNKRKIRSRMYIKVTVKPKKAAKEQPQQP